MSEQFFWWLSYLRVFTLNTPFGRPARFTIGVDAHDGEKIAAAWKMKPYDVVDAYGRPCKQIRTDDYLISIEWLVPPPPAPGSKNPFTWGGQSTADPRCQQQRPTEDTDGVG